MDREDVKAMFPVRHSEKIFHLEDKEHIKEDWKFDLDHWEGLLASREKSVTRIDCKNLVLLCCMPRDINFLLEDKDINHSNDILQDDQNDFTFFYKLGLLSAYLEVAPV